MIVCWLQLSVAPGLEPILMSNIAYLSSLQCGKNRVHVCTLLQVGLVAFQMRSSGSLLLYVVVSIAGHGRSFEQHKKKHEFGIGTCSV